MAHPKDRSGITRRQLLRGAAGAAVLAAGGGVLAGCENTTTAIGACDSGGGASSKLVEPKPLGPLRPAAPAHRQLGHLGADSTTNKAITDGRRGEGGTLAALQLRRLHRPGARSRSSRRPSTARCRSRRTTRPTRPTRSSRRARSHFDVVLGLTGSAHRATCRRKQLMQPLNHEYLPNLEKNIWPELQNPFYDRGARYTVPYVVWSDGIGWRNDKISNGHRRDGRPVGHLLGVARPARARSASSTTTATALRMPMQRDAMHGRRRPDLNTEDPGDHHAGRQGSRAS